MVNVAAIFSTLGNPNSLVPLAVKDITSTAAITGSSFITGKEEGQDRFIDEAGTLLIWLLGIPAFKWLFDKTVFKAYNLDSNFDVRNLKDKDVFEKIKQYAPDEKLKQNLERISKKQGLFKNVALYKFFFATGATIASYIGLTKAKHKYTENKIKNNLIKEFNAQKQDGENNNISKNENPAFKGGVGEVVKNFAFSPVKNMWILDGAITTERLVDSRSPQEFAGYGIREGLYLLFMYYAGNKIQQALEKRADKKYNKSIGLDARVIEGGNLQKAFENKSIEKSLTEFKAIKDAKDSELYEFLIKNPENEVVKVAKDSDIISMYKKPQKWYQIFEKAEKTDKIDTRKFIDLDLVKGTYEKLNTLYEQYKMALNKESSEEFFKGVKKLKRGSIATNIGASIFALSIITPAAMLAKRFYGKDDTEFQTKKEIRNQLIKDGIIS